MFALDQTFEAGQFLLSGFTDASRMPGFQNCNDFTIAIFDNHPIE
jgi:hypothetical protein